MTVLERKRVDSRAMRELSDRVDGLIRAGQWDEVACNAALDEATAYANGIRGARDWLASLAEPEWSDRRITTTPSPYA
ncbi:hypothetical protein [Deinococcus sp. YIM 77859]|uniref:hypothetical protein n=1 Tax=Deinococcus sp. YIM 77859 TaxID=1540221 RepID=UPI0012E04057|nr:hypothetical protein [Deinococcus sp. YIM 77859]